MALFLCLCLSATSVVAAPPPGISESALLEGLPARVGHVDETWHGQNGKTIYLIRDAHDSVTAQKNIARLISHLVQHQDVKTVDEEGYEGEVPTDLFFQDIPDPTTRERVSRQLLEELRIGGAEYAHINRGSFVASRSSLVASKKESAFRETGDGRRETNDFRLIGADSLRGHLENILDYRRAAHAREEILSDLDVIQNEQELMIAQKFPPAVRAWLKLKDRFEKSQLDLTDYLKRSVTIYLNLQSQNRFTQEYPQLTLFVEALDSKNREMIRRAQQIQGREFNHELRGFEKELSGILLEQPTSSEFLPRPPRRASERGRLGGGREKAALVRVYSDYQTIKLARKLAMMELSPSDFADVQTLLKEFKTQHFARFAAEQNSKTVVLSRRWEKKIRRAVRFYQTALSREESVAKRLKEFSVDKSEA
jgi:hypothetical protein